MAYIYKEDKGSNKDTIEALENLEKDIGKSKAIEDELTKVWEKIRMDAFTDCPMDTGSLASTIRVIKTPLGSMMSGNSPIKSITIFDRTIVAGDNMTINPKTNKGVDYASLVHDGYSKGGYINNGKPFLTNALAKNDAELMEAVNKALDKLERRYSEGGQ
jgi:hypothetical protein